MSAFGYVAAWITGNLAITYFNIVLDTFSFCFLTSFFLIQLSGTYLQSTCIKSSQSCIRCLVAVKKNEKYSFSISLARISMSSLNVGEERGGSGKNNMM